MAGTPTVTTELNAAGQLTGDLKISDPDSDRLRYRVIEPPDPAKGQVVINRDGTFAYTPTTDFVATGGADTFAVIATDAPCWQHRGLLGLLSAFFGHRPHAVRQEVDISLANAANVAPTVTVAAIGQPDPTGAVVYRADVVDPDSTVFSYAVASGPGHGTLDNNDDGTFTYHPDTSYYAYQAGGGADGFTIAVDDLEGGVTQADGAYAFAPGQKILATTAPLYGTPWTGNGNYVVLSRDGSRGAIITTDDGGSYFVTLLDATGATGTPIQLDGTPQDSVVVNHDGTVVAVPTVKDGRHLITVIDPATNAVANTIDLDALGYGAQFVGFSRDTALAAIGVVDPDTGQYGVRLIDTATGTAAELVPLGGSAYMAAPVSADGSTAVVVSTAGGSFYLTRIDTATNTAGTPVLIATNPTFPDGNLGLSGDFSRAVIGLRTLNPNAFATLLVDTAAGTTSGPFAATGIRVSDHVVAENGEYAATMFQTPGSSTVTIYDLSASIAAAPITLTGGAFALTLSANGIRGVVVQYVPVDDSFELAVIDTAANSLTTVALRSNGGGGPALSADGERAYIALLDRDGQPVLRTLDLQTTRVIGTIALGGQPYDTVVLTSDGSRAYELTVDDSGKYTVAVIDTGAGTPEL